MSLKNISAIIGIAIGVFGALQAYAVLPFRVLTNEKKIDVLERKIESDHDLLIQISQDVKNIKERVK